MRRRGGLQPRGRSALWRHEALRTVQWSEPPPCTKLGNVKAPEIRYTQRGDVSIAYAISGDGPIDVVFVHGYMSNLEVEWEDPGHVEFFTKLAAAG